MENQPENQDDKHRALRNLLLPGLAFLLLTAIIVVAFSLRGSAQAGGTVTLLFFDRNGTALTPTQVRSVSNNGGAGYNSDFLLNPANMRAISSGSLYTSGTNLAFNIPSQAVALAFNWPTLPGGFHLLILDNGGAGFSTGATINFTYQAALDVKKKLDTARSARPDYVPSAKFTAAYQSASSQLAGVDVYSPESSKGKAGQLALDQLAVAYDAMLAEHGPVYAAANKSTVTPWIGFTIDTVSNYQVNVDLAASLAAPYAWIRIVFDAGQAPSTYTTLVNYAKSKGVKVLGQPVDSTYDKSYTRAQYKQRFIDYITAFPQIDAWEVGNEVNGSWLSSDIGLRIADAAAEVKARAPGKPTFLTFFWQINTDSVANSMFTWANANLPASTRANIDVVTFSQYQEQAPMGVAFDQVMKTLRAEFPTQKIGLGELGYWIPGQQFWWAYNQTDAVAAKRAVAEQYYNAAFDYPGSIGGVFWWTFITDFKSDTGMQQIVKMLRDKLLSGAPTPTPTPSPSPSPTATATPTPTPTATPSPTATATPTPSPTPTATPTATPSPTATPKPAPGGIVFNGAWSAMAKIPATATYQDFYQTVPVTPNANHTASVWVKGSGSLELQIWGNANWTRRLASVRINAGSTWTKVTTPVFNAGNRQRVYLGFDTAFSNAAGTMYLDEVFLGTSRGVNRVTNPGFESGNTGWSNDAPAIFSIQPGQ
jgi:cell division septation protein DedD